MKELRDFPHAYYTFRDFVVDCYLLKNYLNC